MKLGIRRRGAASLTLSDFKLVPGIIEVSEVFTDPWHRNKGIADRLLVDVCKEADKHSTVLMLMPDHEWHEKWYAKHGFTTIQTKPKTIMARQPNKE